MKKIVKATNNRAGRRLQKNNNERKSGIVIILMSTPVSIQDVKALLDMPSKNADRGVRAREILNGCTNNNWVTISEEKIELVQEHIDLYDDATPANRKERWRTVKNDLTALMSLFQRAANDSPENAIEIIKSGKFKVKDVTPRPNQYFHAENTTISGRIELFAEGGGHNTAHDWLYSFDNITFIRVVPTVNAHTFMDGFKKGQTVYFKHQLITGKGPQGFDNTIDILVN